MIARPLLAWFAAALAASATLSGTGAAQGEPRYPFNHAEHAARDPTAACTDCHAATRDGLIPTLRTARCQGCHDAIPAVAPRQPEAALKVVVPHGAHGGVECTTCHARRPVTDDRQPEHAVIATSSTCLTCHAREPRAPSEQACARCHGTNQKQLPPATHGANSWRREHGRGSLMFGAAGHGTNCTLCHRESSCRACHRVERPADHTAVWGKRMHGVRAAFDRQRCQSCHETGQCIACHRVTAPTNHGGAWNATHGLVARGRADTSCLACHRPRFCIDCHKGER